MKQPLKRGKLLACFRENRLPAVFIQHLSANPEATSFRSGTPGALFFDAISPLPGEPVVCKHYPNSFRDTNLLELLRAEEVSRLVICGMMTHMCVDATTRAAFDYGFACIVAADACATRNLSFAGEKVSAALVQRAFLAALDGTYGRVMNADEICTADPDSLALFQVLPLGVQVKHELPQARPEELS